ncbi:MAG: PAC2 family protein [Infirmifilum sp.]
MEEIPAPSFVVIGLPDVGLVGPIATSHLVKQWGLRNIGYIDSPSIPPVILFHESSPLFPIRVYGGYKGNDFVLVVHSDIAIPPHSISSLASFLVSNFQERKAKRLFLLGGLAVQDRINIDTPKTYAASIEPETLEFAKNKGIEPLQEGFIGGVYAQILKEGYKNKLSVLALLAECFLNYPDPGASASSLQAFSRLTGKDVDVKQLIEQEEEIRLKLRELMKRTIENMKGAGKEYEYTIPALYV